MRVVAGINIDGEDSTLKVSDTAVWGRESAL